jgi:hypothetical protein
MEQEFGTGDIDGAGVWDWRYRWSRSLGLEIKNQI